MKRKFFAVIFSVILIFSVVEVFAAEELNDASKADIMFFIDSSASMGGYIDNVKTNVSILSNVLVNSKDMDVRFSVIQYQSNIGVRVYELGDSGDIWTSEPSRVESTLNLISTVFGNGSAIRAINAMLSNDNFRDDASRFGFILTNDDTRNPYYRDHTEAETIQLMKSMDIHMSVISNLNYEEEYHEIYTQTDGKFIDISSPNYYYLMLGLADYIDNVTHNRSHDVTVPEITIEDVPETAVGVQYDIEISTKVSGDVYYSVESGTLPPGLRIEGNRIVGTPTQAGTYTFTIRAQTLAGHDLKEFTINVASEPAPEITLEDFPNATVGTSYDIELKANVTDSVIWTLDDGELPPGMYISGNRITGTPTEAGTYIFTLKAENISGYDTKLFIIVVNTQPVIISGDTPYGSIRAITPEELEDGVIERIAELDGVDPDSIFFITSANILPPEEPADWMKQEAKDQNLEFTAKLDGLKFNTSNDEASSAFLPFNGILDYILGIDPSNSHARTLLEILLNTPNSLSIWTLRMLLNEPYNRNHMPLSEWRKENPTTEPRYLFEFNVPSTLESKDVSDTVLYYHERNSTASRAEFSAAFDLVSAWEVHELLGNKADKWYGKTLILMAPLHGISFSLWLLNPILGAIFSFLGGGCNLGTGAICVFVVGGLFIIRKFHKKR